MRFVMGGFIMGLWEKKVDFDIHCMDRTLKNIIDGCCREKPKGEYEYEARIKFYVREGIKHKKLLEKILADGYAKHKSDPLCDIPDYKTFLSQEQFMIDHQEQYIGKTICVEGYIAYSLALHNEWRHDNAAVFISPIPCQTEIEKDIYYDLVDTFHATDEVILVSDKPLPTQAGTHIRAYGVPSFYEVDNGERPGKVHILVREYEILED